ncbi:MAG: hypothetical protein C4551_01370 [Bacillota bacterium]|nr:MAG: hypothetical protein C4551_01370 [Bacillota bacterium]
MLGLTAAAALVVVALVAALAAREKARQKDRELNAIRRRDLPDPRHTPFSQGLVDLVAVAGGIYLSLVMVSSFVGLALPGKVGFLGAEVDPVAAIAVALALVEPFLSRLFEKTS